MFVLLCSFNFITDLTWLLTRLSFVFELIVPFSISIYCTETDVVRLPYSDISKQDWMPLITMQCIMIICTSLSRNVYGNRGLMNRLANRKYTWGVATYTYYFLYFSLLLSTILQLTYFLSWMNSIHSSYEVKIIIIILWYFDVFNRSYVVKGIRQYNKKEVRHVKRIMNVMSTK